MSDKTREPEQLTELTQLRELLSPPSSRQRALVLTGAGISTDSGIPAYRDDNGNWIHSKPVQAAEFYKDEHIRKRYWLRSMLGWPRMQAAQPNDSHHVLARFEAHGLTQCLITQNVDNLHQRAHSKHVVDLHGNLQSVICLQCHSTVPRGELQDTLQQSNPSVESAGATMGPDGDAVATNLDELLASFIVPDCPNCGGTLKPDVVFFGENVPADRVDYCMAQLNTASLLLCIGTSLTVFSGFRFCRAANKLNIPIAIINNGKTRADELADCIINTSCVMALNWLHDELC